MGSKMLTTASGCLYAGSMRCLTHSITSKSATVRSLTTAPRRLFVNRSCGFGVHLVRVRAHPLHQPVQLKRRDQCHRGIHLSQVASTARAASGLAASTSQAEPLQRKVSHILVKPDQENILDEVEERLEDGEDFRMLAGELSECRGSRMRGGDIGWIQRGQTTPMFEQAAFEADIGELVRVETQFGLHLIRVQAERQQAGIRQMSVSELAEILQDPERLSQVQLVDVREEVEERVASVPEFQLKPLSRMRDWGRTVTRELDPFKHTIVMCHHGMRSQQAAEYLQSLGFAQLSNLEGGIHAYSLKVDPTVPMY
ncbi:TPA: hypothetical protein ACH3X2_004913 [Trebouxia sp. C0005]